MLKAKEKGTSLEEDWNRMSTKYEQANPALANQFREALDQQPPEGWDREIPVYQPGSSPRATREISSDFINAVAGHLPWLMGGSADLEPSTKTLIKSSGYFSKGHY